MTTKEAIYEKVEQLDDDRAKMILDYIVDLMGSSSESPNNRDSVETPTTANASIPDPRLALIGMVRSAQPTNIAEHKDEYIADSILHRDTTGS